MEFIPMIVLAQKGSKIYPNTNLPITLWLYFNNQKENIVYMQNNYNKYTTGNDLLPISIDKDNPKLLEDKKLNVSQKDLKKVLKFVKQHYNSLMDCINQIKIDYSIMEFTCINKFNQTVIDGFFIENITHKHTEDLPVDLYCYCNGIDYDDERNLYSLLMVNKYDNTKGKIEDCVTVSIDKENPKLLYDVKLGISEDDFTKVKEFIKKNYEVFDKYIKNEITSHDLHEILENNEERN